MFRGESSGCRVMLAQLCRESLRFSTAEPIDLLVNCIWRYGLEFGVIVASL